MSNVNQAMDFATNVELRSEILQYSLFIEDAINSLLLTYLGIINKTSTKLFGSKAGISFKNKIDLLYDIDVFSKDEHSDLELLMNFRNKFLHDIHSNSFISVLDQFDNGIKNKFKKHLDDQRQIKDEDSCRRAYSKLFSQNIKVIRNKYEKRRILISDKADLIKSLLQNNVRLIDLTFNFIDELLKEIELSELENPKVEVLANTICSKCVNFTNTLQTDEELLKLRDKWYTELANDEKKNIFFK